MAYTIPPGLVHKVMAETDLIIFEVSTPDLDDVLRLRDEHGRA